MVEGGASIRVLARKYCLSEDSLSRHRKNHLPKAAIAAATESRAFDHHRKLHLLEKVLFSVLHSRLKEEDHGLVLRTHQQLLRHFEFELRLSEVEQIRKDLAELADLVREREEHR
jgi:hypothetical protein